MRLLVRRLSLLTMLLCAAAPAVAATAAEFYLSLLQRGITSFEGERYPEATNYLKIAAFGLVDSIENYQRAQVYLTLTFDRLGDSAKAREAARRVIAAERIQRKFATIALPAGVASSFDTLVTRLLGSADAAFLRRPPQAPVSQPQPPKPQQTPAVPSQKPPTPTPAAPKPTGSTTLEDPAKKPVEKPVVKPAPPATSAPIVPRNPPAQTPRPQTSAPQGVTAAPRTTPPKTTTPSASAQPLTASEATARLGAGERALATAQLGEARRVYRTLLDASGVSRETFIRVAEGLYRARDFEGALLAFAKAGTLRRGEEPYHYYMAVAYYETRQYGRAKSEIAAAVPFIEITPDVARYRAKIEATID